MPRPPARASSEPRPSPRIELEPTAEDASAPPNASRTMLIGEVAAATGLTQRTLRYYEEIGLLPQSARLEGGFRLYTETDVSRLRRITELKRLLGFSLVEIKELIELDDERRERRTAYHRSASPDEGKAHVTRSLELARRQLAQLDQRLAGLLELKAKTEERIGRYLAELDRLTGEGEADSSDGQSDRSAHNQTGRDAT